MEGEDFSCQATVLGLQDLFKGLQIQKGVGGNTHTTALVEELLWPRWETGPQ